MQSSKLYIYLKLLRPHQWIKNSFVLVGIIFGHAYQNASLVSSALLTFIAFCCVSSSVYIYNDIADYQHDTLHPIKKNRPIAMNQISKKAASIICVILFILSILCSNIISIRITTFILAYFLLNFFYTHFFKNQVILDVFAISAGFMLRIFAGTTGLYIIPSPWLLFCGFSLTLFLGFTKRRSELFYLDNPNSFTVSRTVLKNYGVVFLDKIIGITASCSIISYALYTMNPDTIRAHHTQNLIYTLPFVVYGIFRYLYLLHHQTHKGQDTAKDLLTDNQMIFILLSWILLVFYLISG